MRIKSIFLFICFFLFFLARSEAAAVGSSQLQASNLLNPNISVIGWIQAETGRRHLAPGEEDAAGMQLKEAEIAYQAVVDPYTRADVFLSVTPDEAAIEEGYLTWFALPGNLGLKAGKFKANFGKFNRTHTAETAFADRPLVHEKFFGEEGLAGTGASLAWQIPTSAFFLNIDLEAITSPAVEGNVAIAKARKKDLTYVARLSSYYDLTESANITLGFDGALGPAGEFLDVSNSSHTLKSRLAGTDVTFRWKNPRQAIYRSFFWQTEIFWDQRDVTNTEKNTSLGLFSHVEYQFAQRWRIGGRYDYTQSPVDHRELTRGGLAYLSFYPSEFSLISVQGRRVREPDGANENLGFLKVTFNIGPHGAHPF